MKLHDLKQQKADELLKLAEELEVENASSMLKQEMIFSILKQHAENGKDQGLVTGHVGSAIGCDMVSRDRGRWQNPPSWARDGPVTGRQQDRHFGVKPRQKI